VSQDLPPIRLSRHAAARARERGATDAEIRTVIASAPRAPAARGKWVARLPFAYGARSPVDGMRYNEKTVEVIFAEEPAEIVVVTVKVFYAGREE
jgi:hypothetical protein